MVLRKSCTILSKQRSTPPSVFKKPRHFLQHFLNNFNIVYLLSFCLNAPRRQPRRIILTWQVWRNHYMAFRDVKTPKMWREELDREASGKRGAFRILS